MAKIDFNDILSQKVGSADRPKPLPEGTYFGIVASLPKARLVKTKEGEKPVITVTFGLQEAGEDVDADELAQAGGLLLNDGSPKKVSLDFWVDDESRYRLDDFIVSFGIEDKAYDEAFEELVDKEVQLFVKLDTYQSQGQDRTVNRVQRAFAKG